MPARKPIRFENFVIVMVIIIIIIIINYNNDDVDCNDDSPECVQIIYHPYKCT